MGWRDQGSFNTLEDRETEDVNFKGAEPKTDGANFEDASLESDHFGSDCLEGDPANYILFNSQDLADQPAQKKHNTSLGQGGG
jgi:hypothetical protein